MPDFSDNTQSSVNPQSNDSIEGKTFATGQILGGKYKIISLLGRGGMGVVYKVQQIFLNKELALKVLDSRQVSNEQQTRRFQLEAKAAYSLNHPNLVKVHDFGLLDNDQPYLVMDYIDGINLGDYIKEHGRIPLSQAVPIFEQASLGLYYAHQQSVIHRDIKPSNIMLVSSLEPGAPGCVKIVDFGIAKIAGEEGGELQALTKTGEIFGSPLYMSPEQCSGDLIDQRTDIYSLGCSLFEALSGTPPHVGANALRTMMLHQTGNAPSLREASLGIKFPAGIEQIVRKMIAKNPHERYQKLDEVARDLAIVAADGNVKLPDSNGKSRGRAPGTVFGAPGPVLLVALICLSATIIAAVLFFHKSRDESPEHVASLQPERKPDDFSTDPLSVGLKDTERRTEEERLKSHLAFSSSGPIVSRILMRDGKKQRVFEFPTTAIGEVRVRGHWVKYPKPAQGEQIYPPDSDLVLAVGGNYCDGFDSPSVFTRIGKSEFWGLVFDAPANQFVSDSTEPERQKKRSENLADILQTASSWTNLESVQVTGMLLNKSALQALDSMKHLHDLEISDTFGSELDISRLKVLGQLKRLTLRKSISADILHAISGSPALEDLRLDELKLTPENMQDVVKCKNLKMLSIRNKSVDYGIVAAICKSKSLRSIRFDNARIPTRMVEQLLSSCPDIKEIALIGTANHPIDGEKCTDPRVRHVDNKPSADVMESLE